MSDPKHTPAASKPEHQPESLNAINDAAALQDEPLARTFAELNLSAPVLETLARAQFIAPTPIQAQFIPKALSGRDVMGQAKTGTGKTAAFLVPIFERIKPGEGFCQALILAPTRELALQIHGEIKHLGGGLGFSSVTLYGGASYEPQIEALSAGVDIVVGTPGRLMDHMKSNRLDLSRVAVAVLDEADRMLDLGFRKDIEYILRHCPHDRQTLLLSATIPEDIRKLAQRFMVEPLEVWTAPESLTVDAVEQHFFVCERDQKFPLLLKLLDVEDPALAIIFCGTKMGAKRLAEKLKRVYVNAREIHGDLTQSRRETIMGRFRKGQVRLLIATDVASRGIDVQNITHIVNYDVPYKIEDYVHRIGRTGRIGKSGKAYTFVTREEGSYLTEIELLINKELKRAHFDDLTSKWWPHPPTHPPAEFTEDEPGADDPVAPSGPGKGKSRRRRKGSRSAEPVRNVAAPAAPAPLAQAATDGPAALTAPTAPVMTTEPAATDADDDIAILGAVCLDVLPDGSLETSTVSGAIPDASASESVAPREKRSRSRRRGPGVAIVCHACGKEAVVRFKPSPDRPVFCAACYQVRKAAKPAENDANVDQPNTEQPHDERRTASVEKGL